MGTWVVTDTGGWTELSAGDLPASGVTAGTYGDSTHVGQFTVNVAGQVTAASDVAISGGGGTGTPTDGWVDDSADTWTYASFTAGPPAVGTFTVRGDRTAELTVGTRIKLTQTTVKYFVVSADPVFGGVNTTVTVTAGTDYTLANAAISNNFHSYMVTPQGYPGWFNCGVNAQGFSALTANVAQFAVNGRTCFVSPDILGTSNATTFTWTAPLAAQGPVNVLALAAATDNSVTLLVRIIITTGATTVTMAIATIAGSHINIGPGAWTGSGTKGMVGGGILIYPI